MAQHLLANYQPGGGEMRVAREDRSTRTETEERKRWSGPERRSVISQQISQEQRQRKKRWSGADRKKKKIEQEVFGK